MRRSLATTSSGTSSRVRYFAFSAAICSAAACAASLSEPLYSTSTPTAGGRSADRLCRYDSTVPSNAATLRTSSSPPTFADMSAIACSTVLSPSDAAFSASTSAACEATAAPTMASASVWNSSFFATKCVSQFRSIRALPLAATSPSAAARSARLPTSFAPLMRSNSTALSKSPSLSVSAFLQSSMPAPVSSRSRLTSAAVKFAISAFRGVGFGIGGSVGGGPRGRAGPQLLLPFGQRLGRFGIGLVAVAQSGAGLQTLGDSRSDHLGEQRGRADRVVVARDRVVDEVGGGVGVEDRYP